MLEIHYWPKYTRLKVHLFQASNVTVFEANLMILNSNNMNKLQIQTHKKKATNSSNGFCAIHNCCNLLDPSPTFRKKMYPAFA